VVHWYRNINSTVPSSKSAHVMAMVKAIHGQEDQEAALAKARDVAQKLVAMKLPEVARAVEADALETLGYMKFPRKHWRCLRSNNMLERVMREIRRRTRVVGAFPDGKSALMLCAARLRYVASKRWATRRYMNMNWLKQTDGRPAGEQEAA